MNTLKNVFAVIASIAMLTTANIGVAADATKPASNSRQSSPTSGGGDSTVAKVTAGRAVVMAATVGASTAGAVVLGVGTVLTPSKIGCGPNELCR